MSVLSLRALRAAAFLALTTASLLALASSRTGDLYDRAVSHPGRSADDLKRDPVEHPAEMLRLAGIKPGMQVGDYMAADGYWSELASYVVGPKGHVLLLNNPTWDYWSENRWQGRISGRLPNVEHRTVDPEHLELADHSLDALLFVKAYHDFYWDDPNPKDHWPKVDMDRLMNEIARVVKPGGVVLLIDHSARAGTGSADAGPLHRIDEQYARADFEKHGFTVIGTSDLLRRPDDPRDQITYKGPMVGKTDRFVLVLRRSG